MKTYYFIATLFAFLFGFSALAAESKAKAQVLPNSCSVRLSNSSINKINLASPGFGTGFCSGTMTSNNILVTAAHCINDVVSGKIDKLSEIKKNAKINIAFSGDEKSQASEITKGINSAIYSEKLSKHSDRAHYLEKGTKELINEDFVILKLQNEISGANEVLCPRIPTALDCDVFKAQLAQGPHNILANFFKSTKLQDSFYVPQSRQFESRATSISQNMNLQYLVAQFQSDNEIVNLRKGDSGTGLIWDSPTGPVIVGVQSGMSGQNDQLSYFSDLCSHINSPIWNKFIQTNE